MFHTLPCGAYQWGVVTLRNNELQGVGRGQIGIWSAVACRQATGVALQTLINGTHQSERRGPGIWKGERIRILQELVGWEPGSLLRPLTVPVSSWGQVLPADPDAN